MEHKEELQKTLQALQSALPDAQDAPKPDVVQDINAQLDKLRRQSAQDGD